MYKYKVYDLKEDGEVGQILDITNNYEKWEKKLKNFEVLICITKEYRALIEKSI